MNKIRTLLIGMTGFGNNAFRVLLNIPSIQLVGVVTTKRQQTPFPYYECPHLWELINAHKEIVLFEGINLKDSNSLSVIKNLTCELIVVANFNQIIPQKIIDLPRLGIINIHPSLLPRYRGPTPTSWAIFNGEEETGVTIHFIENEEVDKGRIIAQSRIKIEQDDDGRLRQRLAEHSEELLFTALGILIKGKQEFFREQDETFATYYPKRAYKEVEIDPRAPLNQMNNWIRAMNPYPGAFVRYNDKKYYVSRASLFPENGPVGVYAKDGIWYLRPEGEIEFELSRRQEEYIDNA